MSVIEEDIKRQLQLENDNQNTFSEAYLSGRPNKRRKVRKFLPDLTGVLFTVDSLANVFCTARSLADEFCMVCSLADVFCTVHSLGIVLLVAEWR